MASDPNPALRAELLAALAILKPQIRGLSDIAAASISAELLTQVETQITERSHRRDLIQNVLDGLDAVLAELVILEADGYPALPPIAVLGSLFSEIQEENSDFEAAVAVFTELTSVGFDSTVKPVDVPQSVPSQTPKP